MIIQQQKIIKGMDLEDYYYAITNKRYYIHTIFMDIRDMVTTPP